MSSQPKVTSVELVVRTADGQVRRVDFNGDGHHIRVDLEQAEDREGLRVVDSLRPDRDQCASTRVVATVTAASGWGPEPLLTLQVEDR